VIDQQRSSLSLRNGYLAERGMIWMNSTKKSVLYTAHTGRSKLQHKRDDADSFPVHPTNGQPDCTSLKSASSTAAREPTSAKALRTKSVPFFIRLTRFEVACATDMGAF